MIQFNLLPDVKLEYVKAQRTKHTVTSASLIAASSAFVIFLLLFLTVNVAQRTSIKHLDGDIKKYGNELKNTPDLDKILTIQSQLDKLPSLHADKVAAGRTFSFLQQLTPSNVSLSDVTTDYAAGTMTIAGQASSLDQVNTFADTLKFTKFTNKEVSKKNAFSGVVLSQFSRSLTGTTFTIGLTFAPAIFDNDAVATLTIPAGLSTRSVLQQPTFLKAPTNTNGNSN